MHKHIHPHLHTIVHAHKQANNTNTYTSYKYIHETAQIVYQEMRAALSYMVTLVALQTLARCGHLTTVWHQRAARGRAPEILRTPFSPADSPCAFVAKLFTSHAAAALPAGRQPCAPRNVNEAGGWGGVRVGVCGGPGDKCIGPVSVERVAVKTRRMQLLRPSSRPPLRRRLAPPLCVCTDTVTLTSRCVTTRDGLPRDRLQGVGWGEGYSRGPIACFRERSAVAVCA